MDDVYERGLGGREWRGKDSKGFETIIGEKD